MFMPNDQTAALCTNKLMANEIAVRHNQNTDNENIISIENQLDCFVRVYRMNCFSCCRDFLSVSSADIHFLWTSDKMQVYKTCRKKPTYAQVCAAYGYNIISVSGLTEFRLHTHTHTRYTSSVIRL